MPLASPHRQGYVVDPFMKWSSRGVLVQLELDADLIRPISRVGIPSLIKGIDCTIQDQRIVAILRGIIDELVVLLNVVPPGRPVRAGGSIEKPSVAVAVPCRPVAISIVALAAGHEFFA